MDLRQLRVAVSAAEAGSSWRREKAQGQTYGAQPAYHAAGGATRTAAERHVIAGMRGDRMSGSAHFDYRLQNKELVVSKLGLEFGHPRAGHGSVARRSG